VRIRVVNSVAVVLVGLVPTLIGGPVFAALMMTIGVIAYREFLDLCSRTYRVVTRQFVTVGSCAIIAFALAAYTDLGVAALFATAAFAVAVPLVMLFPRFAAHGTTTTWSWTSAGSFYIGLPVYAAVMLRAMPGTVEASWLVELSERLSLRWESAPRGLAWTLTVILIIWIGDSAAYLIGQAVGRRKLAPSLSPQKTIEGAFAGFIASVIVGGLAFQGFGLGLWWLGAAFGGAVGLAGQLGDLSESLFKRHAGVKDSGALIPGHGGMLDRIDALLFAFPAGYILAASLDRLGAP
jgi:phosphatidate cytidylyltransferase